MVVIKQTIFKTYFIASTLIFWHAYWKYFRDNNDDILQIVVGWLLLSSLLEGNLVAFVVAWLEIFEGKVFKIFVLENLGRKGKNPRSCLKMTSEFIGHSVIPLFLANFPPKPLSWTSFMNAFYQIDEIYHNLLSLRLPEYEIIIGYLLVIL